MPGLWKEKKLPHLLTPLKSACAIVALTKRVAQGAHTLLAAAEMLADAL